MPVLTKYPRPWARTYGRIFPPCPSKTFLGDGQRVEVSAETMVTQKHHPLGHSLDLGVLLGNLRICNKDSEFSHLILFSKRKRGGSALTRINCVHGEKGKVLGCCSNTRSSWCTFARHKPPICSLSKKNSGSPWDVLFPFSLCLVWCDLVFPTRNSRFCSVWGPKQQHGSSQENRSLLSVSAQVSLIQTTRKMAKQGG